jgi:hypothetical protein
MIGSLPVGGDGDAFFRPAPPGMMGAVVLPAAGRQAEAAARPGRSNPNSVHRGKTGRLMVGVTVTTAASMPLERKTNMHTLTFNDNERTLLIEILEAHLAKLPHEIHQTDSHAYRDMLEEKQSTLQQLGKRLQES